MQLQEVCDIVISQKSTYFSTFVCYSILLLAEEKWSSLKTIKTLLCVRLYSLCDWSILASWLLCMFWVNACDTDQWGSFQCLRGTHSQCLTRFDEHKYTSWSIKSLAGSPLRWRRLLFSHHLIHVMFTVIENITPSGRLWADLGHSRTTAVRGSIISLCVWNLVIFTSYLHLRSSSILFWPGIPLCSSLQETRTELDFLTRTLTFITHSP